MIGRIATLIGYSKAPKATFVLKHPVKGTKAFLAARGLKGLVTGRTGMVLGAVAAVPVGLWAASRMRTSANTSG
jgi:hypothetical protein